LVIWTLARTVLVVIALVVLYFLAPMDHPPDGAAWWTLVGALVGITLLCGWQAYAISKSPIPRLRAVCSFVILVPLFVVVFAAAYFVLDVRSSNFNEPLSRVDSLYFTLSTFATVGYGDIVPTTETARVIVMLQMIGGALVLAVAARVFVLAVRANPKRHSDTTPEIGNLDDGAW